MIADEHIVDGDQPIWPVEGEIQVLNRVIQGPESDGSGSENVSERSMGELLRPDKDGQGGLKEENEMLQEMIEKERAEANELQSKIEELQVENQQVRQENEVIKNEFRKMMEGLGEL